ncbi:MULTISPECIES: FAD:protein FMN transferase [Methylotenera]|uniref:FAD:protein FMN transferase n=1 Tax=Methylotenera TaxID=359407 RepID=UPI000361F763|nr:MULTISPECIES: FAD:protein FMN transferase [Methylotenera]
MRLFLLLVFGSLLSSCSKPELIHTTQSYVFGTEVAITIYGEQEEDAAALANEIIRNFQDLHNRLHAWRPSEIRALNHAFKNDNLPVTVKPDVAAIISDATSFSIQSKGAFNPAIGGLIDAWGFHKDEVKPIKINDNKIQSLVKGNPQMVDIVIKNGKISSTNPSVRLDLDEYIKGYALDTTLVFLREHGVKNALINIGGNFIALGKHGDKPWRVSIQHPRKPNAIAKLDLESGWAISTSGDYQRYFKLKGKRYSHIIDPVTGYPAQDTQAVTVLVPPQSNAGTLSDVATIPIFIAKPGLRSQAAKDMGVENYLVIESNDKIFISPPMVKRLTWIEPSTAQHVSQTQP